MKSKLNNIYLGLITGISLPVISFFILYKVRYDNFSVSGFIDLMSEADILTKVLSLTVLPNLLLFFIFIWTNKLVSARGVLFSTIVYAILIFVLKFLF